MKGFVYILTNKAYPGLVKVGMTDENPKERAKDLFTTAVPHPFKVFGCVEVENPKEVEKLAHKKLSKYRETKNREFFRIDAEAALEILEEISGEVEYTRREKAKKGQAEKDKRLWTVIFRLVRDRDIVDKGVISTENIDEIKQAISAGADVNLEGKSGRTPLIAASSVKGIVEILINNGADIHKKHLIHTPLSWAASCGHKDTVNLLIAKGEDVNAKSVYEITPLREASKNGCMEIAELLIANGADVNAADWDRRTPLHFAIYEGHTETADLLRSHGAMTGKGSAIDEFTEEAVLLGDIKKVEEAITVGADVNAKDNCGYTLLHIAARQGHKEITELLIYNGADLNANIKYEGTPLNAAADNGHKEIAELLIRKGAVVDVKGKSYLNPLNSAAKSGHNEVAELLIAKGANVNAKSSSSLETPLVVTAWHGRKEIAKLLIAKGADMNGKDRFGETPLHKAAVEGHKEIVELLIAADADVNAKANNGLTPLDAAEYVYEPVSPEDKAARKETANLLRKHGGKMGAELKAEGK